MSKAILLESALAVIGLLLATTTIALVGASCARALTARRRRPRARKAQTALARYLSGEELGAAEITELRSLSTAVRVALLAKAGTVLRGGGRERLTALAAALGVLGWAERSSASRRWWRRLRAVRLYTLLGAGEAQVPALLSDPNREVRAAAATWVADHTAPQRVKRLLDLLGDDELLVRFAAKNALLRIGRAAAEPVAARIPRASERELEELLEVAIGLAESRVATPALPLVSSPSPRIRSLAATLIVAAGGAGAVATVESMLDDPEAEVRAAAIAGLGKVGHWPSGPALAAALRDPAWEVRRQAALALRALGAPGLVLLRRALTDEDRYARDMARQVLDLPGPTRTSSGTSVGSPA